MICSPSLLLDEKPENMAVAPNSCCNSDPKYDGLMVHLCLYLLNNSVKVNSILEKSENPKLSNIQKGDPWGLKTYFFSLIETLIETIYAPYIYILTSLIFALISTFLCFPEFRGEPWKFYGH